MSGSGSGRKKEMRGPWTAERMREGGGGWDGGTVPPWRNGFLGSDIVVAEEGGAEGV